MASKSILDLSKRFQAARSSSLGLRVLNTLLLRVIPFNYPHRLKIKHLTEDEVVVHIPFIRKNQNHIGGLHACVLATAGEYSTGLLLLQMLGTSEYRLIMQELTVNYYYQGKVDANSVFRLDEEAVRKEIETQLNQKESAKIECVAEVHDIKGNHLCSVHVFWQLKPWSLVKTGK